MSTEAATPTVEDVGPTQSDYPAGALDRWEEAQKAATQPASAPAETKPAETPKGDGIPEEFLKEKAPVVDPDENLLNEKPAGPIKHDHFERVQAKAKREIEAARKERDELSSKIKEIEAQRGQPDDKTKAELEQLRKDRAEFESTIERIAFERSPRFQKQFVAREKATIERATKAFTDAGGEASLLPEILAATPSRRFAMLDELEMSGSGKQYVISVLSEHDAIQAEKAAALSESRERLTAWEQEEKAQQEAAQAQRTTGLAKLMDEVIVKAAAEFEPLRKVEGNDAWNAEVEERIARVRRIAIGESTDKEILETVARGVAAERIHQMFRSVKEQNKALLEKVATLEAAQPGTANGRATAAINNKDETPEDRWERAQAAAIAASGR